MDLLHATTLLNEECVAVDLLRTAGGLLIEIAHLQNILKTIESHLDDLVVGAHEEVTERTNAALRHKIANLLRLLEAARGRVADSPAGLLARLKVAVLEEVDKRGDDVSIDDSLDLHRVAGRDVGYGPARLLPNAVLVRAKESEEAGKGTAVDDYLGLHIITSDDVTNGPERGCLDRGRGVHEELHQSAGYTRLDDGLYLVVGAVGQVADRPAGIDENLIVEGIHELGKDRQRGRDLRKVRVNN